MSRIDDELEQAVREGEAGASNHAGASTSNVGRAAAPAPARGTGDGTQPGVSSLVSDGDEPKRSWGLLAGLVALGGGVLLFVFNSGEDAVVYAYQVDELKAQAADLGERQVRVQGVLVPGTLSKQDEPCEYRFMMHKPGEKGAPPLQVQYPQCIVPDTFREVKGVDVEVTAEGRMSASGHLNATKIFAKCPSKYEMRDNAAELGKAPEHGGAGPKPEFVSPRVEGSLSDIR